jgi:hypothetical protein
MLSTFRFEERDRSNRLHRRLDGLLQQVRLSASQLQPASSPVPIERRRTDDKPAVLRGSDSSLANRTRVLYSQLRDKVIRLSKRLLEQFFVVENRPVHRWCACNPLEWWKETKPTGQLKKELSSLTRLRI